ncbi:MAG TPA: helix-turn-helix transcriptional regulator [Micromonospora sp.]
MGLSADFLIEELRHARLSRGLNQEEFGKLINYSGSHVSAVETGQRAPKPEYVAAVDRALQTGGIFTRLLRKVHQYDVAPPWLREWIDIEQQAAVLRWYELAWVPGLLQTEAYARAVFRSDCQLTDAEIEARVARRLDRQARLTGENPPQLFVALDETLLHRPIGGPAVMREQLYHLARLNTEERRIRIHVVPSSVGAYIGLDGPFVLATMSDGEEVAYLGNWLGGTLLVRPSDVASVWQHWEATLAEALTLQQSTDLMIEVAKSWI